MNDTVTSGLWLNRVHFGDCRDSMREMIAAGVRVNTCVTSPPYWGLRDYGHAGQLGLEATPDEYVSNMVGVCRLVRELLADDGTLWLNLGDSYAGSGRGGHVSDTSTLQGSIEHKQECRKARGSQLAPGLHAAAAAAAGVIGRAWVPAPAGLKQKDLCGIPWMVAFALRADGWWLRQDIIWHKPNPMPESVRDRCTKSHEYLFLLSKSERYYFDADAIAEPVGEAFATDSRHLTGGTDRNEKEGYEAAGAQNPKGPHRAFGKWSREHEDASGRRMTDNVARARAEGGSHDAPFGMTRNKRSVWTVTTKPYAGAHFATFPPDLIEPCILAGSSAHGHCSACGNGWVRVSARDVQPEAYPDAKYDTTDPRYATKRNLGARYQTQLNANPKHTAGWRATCKCDSPIVPGIAFDPFIGSGTTAQVAQSLGRNWIGCELNEAYEPLQRERTRQTGMRL